MKLLKQSKLSTFNLISIGVVVFCINYLLKSYGVPIWLIFILSFSLSFLLVFLLERWLEKKRWNKKFNELIKKDKVDSDYL